MASAAAMRAANWHAPFLLRQLAHFWSFGVSRGHFPSLVGAPLRFIGAKRPSLREGYLPAAQLPRRAQPKCGETVGFNAFAHSEDRGQCPRHFALLRPLKPTLHQDFPVPECFFPVLGYHKPEVDLGLGAEACTRPGLKLADPGGGATTGVKPASTPGRRPAARVVQLRATGIAQRELVALGRTAGNLNGG